MRTTLDLDDKVLAVARERARREGISLGRAVSQLALLGITGTSFKTGSRGVPLFAPPPGSNPHPVTPELIEQHRDEDE
ncbi:MAG: DUF2191 domain-containing protein [Propionibacteriaceae bacterium]|uniref:DUF2191 domain-containing protein n=1 Tax=Propionibacterium ruminifibrarum TaxID=1962131 RepID=UPI000E6B155F|nr:DUF2191 domain-containing protein [Propionibacterium ruminifibrarum]MBE6477597.1 DUF2191 domain-containing protein [Propionibacteriaceae bacterium]